MNFVYCNVLMKLLRESTSASRSVPKVNTICQEHNVNVNDLSYTCFAAAVGLGPIYKVKWQSLFSQFALGNAQFQLGLIRVLLFVYLCRPCVYIFVCDQQNWVDFNSTRRPCVCICPDFYHEIAVQINLHGKIFMQTTKRRHLQFAN